MADANDIVTPEIRSWIGRKTPLTPLLVMGDSDIRRYADATDDRNPLWFDDAYAKEAGYKQRLLPPTLVGWVPFSLKENDDGTAKDDKPDLRRRVPVPPNYTNVRNAGSETEWLLPAYPNEQLSSQSVITDIVARQGRFGVGIYISQEEQVLNPAGQTVLRRRHTIALFPEKKI
ncbi:MAG: MaoC family dehydratase [Deltaproteobacteria bacterium]|nr:MaoC family dehydratase [Deltaproteobacteria bacterium]